MCRLLGQISLFPGSAEAALAASPTSLLAQSHLDRSRLQKDGWGVAYYTEKATGRAGGSRPRLVVSPRPAFDEEARVRRLAAAIRPRALVAHIRAASNPRGVDPRRLVSRVNTQPYSAGGVSFAHNGTLEIPDEVARFLGPYRSRLRGINDSEVYFWQFMKFLDAYGDAAEALRACVRETRGLWRGCRSRYPRKKAPYTGLNALVSDGRSLHALCHYPAARGGWLTDGRKGWGRMAWLRSGGRVLIASEPCLPGDWNLLEDPEILSVGLGPAGLKVRRTRFRPGD